MSRGSPTKHQPVQLIGMANLIQKDPRDERLRTPKVFGALANTANTWALNERFLKKRYLPLHLLHLDFVLNQTIPWTSVTLYQCTDDKTNKTENNIPKSIQISIDCRHRLKPQKIKGGRNKHLPNKPRGLAPQRSRQNYQRRKPNSCE